MSSNQLLPIARYSLVVCRNNKGKFLCVEERQRKWWICGGGVEKGETHEQAAIREAKQQSGIDIKLKGILAFDSVKFSRDGIRVIYYAEPLDQQAIPKQIPDKQSLGAKFLNLSDILSLRHKWRAPQIYHYPNYIQNGGYIFPLSAFREQVISDI